MEKVVKLIGYKKANSQKTGKPYCQLIILQEVNEREKEWGFVGYRANDSFFMPDDKADYVVPEMVMQDVVLSFEPGMDMRMHLSDIRLSK